jgi:pyruvate-ferredoxin/flavodoxin oxidoreductase
VAVLDRTKEPGSNGEPLYLDVLAALAEAGSRGERDGIPRVIGGRYGLSSKELTPGMAAAVFAELALDAPRRRFTLGITDDVSGTSLALRRQGSRHRGPQTPRAVFYGLGSDGTVGANKNTIKILGAEAGYVHAQAYFVYDSKKSGGLTVSHLRFGPTRSAPYLVSGPASSAATTSGCSSARRRPRPARRRARPCCSTRPSRPTRCGTSCRGPVQQRIIERGLRVCMPSTPRPWPAAPGCPAAPTPCCRPASSRSRASCPPTRPSPGIKAAIRKTYGRRGAERSCATRRPWTSLAALHEVPVPAARTSVRDRPRRCRAGATRPPSSAP